MSLTFFINCRTKVIGQRSGLRVYLFVFLLSSLCCIPVFLRDHWEKLKYCKWSMITGIARDIPYKSKVLCKRSNKTLYFQWDTGKTVSLRVPDYGSKQLHWQKTTVTIIYHGFYSICEWQYDIGVKRNIWIVCSCVVTKRAVLVQWRMFSMLQLLKAERTGASHTRTVM